MTLLETVFLAVISAASLFFVGLILYLYVKELRHEAGQAKAQPGLVSGRQVSSRTSATSATGGDAGAASMLWFGGGGHSDDGGSSSGGVSSCGGGGCGGGGD